jgi:hypothetical protein
VNDSSWLRPSIIMGATADRAACDLCPHRRNADRAGFRLTGHGTVADLMPRAARATTAADIAAEARLTLGVGRATTSARLTCPRDRRDQSDDLPDGEHAYGVPDDTITSAGPGRSTDVDDTDLRAALGTPARATGTSSTAIVSSSMAAALPVAQPVESDVRRAPGTRKADLGSVERPPRGSSAPWSCRAPSSWPSPGRQPGSASPSSTSETALRVVATTTATSSVVGGDRDRGSIIPAEPAGTMTRDSTHAARRADLVISNGAGLDDSRSLVMGAGSTAPHPC